MTLALIILAVIVIGAIGVFVHCLLSANDCAEERLAKAQAHTDVYRHGGAA